MVAKRYPQTAYAGLARSLQSEWMYLQRVTPDVGAHFLPVEQAIATKFLPALLDLTEAEVAPLRSLLALPVKLGGLGIPDPQDTNAGCHAASLQSTDYLQQSLLSGQDLCALRHKAEASAGQRSARRSKTKEQQAALDAILEASTPTDARRIKRSAETGAWLTSLPSLLNGTELSAEEFRDSLRLRLGITPASLPHRCDGCGDRFTLDHAMSCRKGGLILLRHNDLAAEWGHMCGQARSKSAVHDEPLIHNSRDVQIAGSTRTEPQPELRGDVSVHGFWARGTTTIFDIRVTDTDARSQRNVDPHRVLQRHEKEKKDKYGALCLARRRHFTPLVFSVDGLMGTETKAASQRLASLLSSKWKRSYSDVCGYVRSRLSVALARSTSRCLRAERTPVQSHTATWASGTGLRLYQ